MEPEDSLLCSQYPATGPYPEPFCGSLSPRHGASSCCGWSIRPPDAEGSSSSRGQRIIALQLRDWVVGQQILTAKRKGLLRNVI
jgi:hypothetical protein